MEYDKLTEIIEKTNIDESSHEEEIAIFNLNQIQLKTKTQVL